MKAIQITETGGPEVLVLRDIEAPVPNDDEVLVDVLVAGVNYIDTYYREGAYHASVPFVPGLEGTGRVVHDPRGEIAEGTVVAWCDAFGSYAEQVCVPRERLVAVPEGVEPAVAASMLLQGITAHYLTDDDCVKMLRALDNAVNVTSNDKPRNMLARRTRIAALSLTLWRYNDMIEPAKRLGFTLRPRETIWKEWKEAIFAPEHKGANYGMLGENFGTDGYERRVMNMFTNSDPVPTVFPRKASVIRIDPGMMTGGKKMTRQRDKDGTNYAQIKVALHNEAESIWMNPGYSEIGYTAKADEAGDWYIFATVRTGATVPVDNAVAYMGIYQQWYPNGVKTGGSMEIANLQVQGRLGDTAWHTVSLGKRRLFRTRASGS